MKKQIKVWLANLGIEVPVYKYNKKKGQVTIKVSDVPKKIAKSAGIDKQEFAKYWVGKNAGGNKIVKSPEEIKAERREKRAYGMVKVKTGTKLAWVSMENKHGWSLGLNLGKRVVWLRNIRFKSVAEIERAMKSGTVFVHLKETNENI